jgi:hypothetical protein
MIKASYINNILETYLETVRAYDNSPEEVFVNPSRKELRKDIGRFVKFICDANTKQFYAWKEKAFHQDITSALHLQPSKTETIYDRGRSFDVSIDFCYGYAEIIGNTYRVTTLDPVDTLKKELHYRSKNIQQADDLSRTIKVSSAFCEEDWSWVDKYVEMTDYMTEFVQALEDAKSKLR